MRDGAGRCPAGRVGGEKLRPARQRLAHNQESCSQCCHNYTTRTRRNYERSQLHGTACHANRLHLQRPCSLFALFIRQTAQPRKLARVDPGDAEPTRAAARGFVGPRCATKSLRGCFTASASSACHSLHGRRHTVGVARGRAHVLRQVTLSARRRPRERGRTCAAGPSDSFSDNQNWPERISSLT